MVPKKGLQQISCRMALILFASAAAGGQPAGIELSLPLDCAIGSVCRIQNFFDHDSGPGFRDYHCGVLGYDGHDGTDIRLPNLRMMQAGVTVLAAADGRVRNIRDEMPDVSIRSPGQSEAIRGREAGNAVAIRHGDGWETQYSHMLRGSIRVEPGQMVRAGQALGLVGLSGKTEFPHLHFEVRYQGKSVDPFVGLSSAADCGLGSDPLWSRQALLSLDYQPTGLLQAGFSEGRPISEEVEAGAYDKTRLPVNAAALVFWAEVFGVRKGDVETIRVESPDGTVIIDKGKVLQKNKARWLSYAGKKRRSNPWPAGTYRARYQLARQRGGRKELVIDILRELQMH